MKLFIGLVLVVSCAFAQSNIQLTNEDQCNHLDQELRSQCSESIAQRGRFGVPRSYYHGEDSASEALSNRPTAYTPPRRFDQKEPARKTYDNPNLDIFQLSRKVKTAGGWFLFTSALSVANSLLILNDVGSTPLYVI